jgi:hypothetical protein
MDLAQITTRMVLRPVSVVCGCDLEGLEAIGGADDDRQRSGFIWQDSRKARQRSGHSEAVQSDPCE